MQTLDDSLSARVRGLAVLSLQPLVLRRRLRQLSWTVVEGSKMAKLCHAGSLAVPSILSRRVWAPFSVLAV